MPDSQKMEILLNLALSTADAIREKSMVLGEGYQAENHTWELIVKYSGSLIRLREAFIQVEELIAGYAIVTIPEELIDAFVELEEIEYVEKPKRLYFGVLNGKRESCIQQVTLREPYLTGRGVIVAVLDSGIDYENMSFRHTDGSSRILYLWDQTLSAEQVNEAALPLFEQGMDMTYGMVSAPSGFQTGVEFSKGRIDLALSQTRSKDRYLLVPSRDASGHGTAVTNIAAGSEVAGREAYQGVAPEGDLIIVKLGNPSQRGFPRTTELMRAITYVVRKAASLGMPAAVNISIGNTYGAHDGTSLLERFMDNVSEIGRSVVCVGSGNEGAAGGHVAGNLSTGQIGSIKAVELRVAPYQSSINVQLWKEYVDDFRITLESPSGKTGIVDTSQPGRQVITLEETQILLYVGEPSPYSVRQEIYFDFLPLNSYVNQGIWIFSLQSVKITNGNYDFYLPSSAVLNLGTNFFTPSPEKTLTIPSTASRVLTVGAYNTTYESYADFSGRGYLFESIAEGRINPSSAKPDLVAPGVAIQTIGQGGTQVEVSGTSFAVPFVTGSAALMMEWGMIQGNDRYLYGDDCDIIGLNQRKAHKHWEFRWFSPNLSMQD